LRLLDTCFLIDLLRGDPGAVRAAEALDDGATTAVNVYELIYGVEAGAGDRSARREEAEALISRLEVLPLDGEAAKIAARFMGELHRRGEPVDAMDAFTTAIGLRHGCKVVVTRNAGHFERFPEINVETY
jgi:predicted nucleic acid-binding protein